MAVASVNLDFMARKTEKPEQPRQGRPPGRKPTEVLTTRVPPLLAETFRKAVEAFRPRTTDNAVLAMLVEDWLRSQGLWPPATGSEGKP